MRGMTSDRFLSHGLQPHFNPHPPYVGDDTPDADVYMPIEISIHIPYAGDDRYEGITTDDYFISIHIPLCGG